MVWLPILMLCSVTEDSSLAVAGSHFSAAFASDAFDSRSGACAARRAACPNKTKIPTAHIQKLFFMRLLPLIRFDWLATDETAGLYVGAGARVKGSAVGERTAKRTPTPHLSASADSTGVTGWVFVSADSKGVAGWGSRKCGL